MPLRFRNRRQLEDHFLNHRVEFDPIPPNEMDYEDSASNFSLRPLSETMRREVRPIDLATMTWDRATDEFSIVTQGGYLSTYIVLNPTWHGFASNRAYFEWQLRRKR